MYLLHVDDVSPTCSMAAKTQDNSVTNTETTRCVILIPPHLLASIFTNRTINNDNLVLHIQVQDKIHGEPKLNKDHTEISVRK